MSSALAVGGLSSGIDTKAIVDVLINADRAPARLAESNKAKAQGRLDAIKAMNTRLLALRDAMDEMRQTSNFAGRKATSGNEAALAVSALPSALTSAMTINVKRLATAHQVAVAGQASATADLGGGDLRLRFASMDPGDDDIVIFPTNSTLNGIAEAINAAATGVTAAVINDGSATPFRLVLTSTTTGATNAITKLEGTGDLATIFSGLPSMETITDGLDAQVRLGDKDTGLLLTSPVNVMDQAIPGLTLTLKDVADGITVSVANDAPGVRGLVQKVVDTFNDAQTYFTTNSRFDPVTKTSGKLFGDYDLRNQLDAITRELSKRFTGQPAGFQTLAEVGVSLDTNGKMVIAAEVFDAKLVEDSNALAGLFLAAGVAGGEPIERLTRSVTGSMATKQLSLEENISSFDSRIAAIDARLERRKAFYQAKFLQMEKLTAQFQSQGSSLTNFVNGLNFNRKSSS